MGSDDSERIRCEAERAGSHDALQDVQEADPAGYSIAPPQPPAPNVLRQLSPPVQPSESVQKVYERRAKPSASAVAAERARLSQSREASLERVRISLHQLRSQFDSRGREK